MTPILATVVNFDERGNEYVVPFNSEVKAFQDPSIDSLLKTSPT